MELLLYLSFSEQIKYKVVMLSSTFYLGEKYEHFGYNNRYMFYYEV